MTFRYLFLVCAVALSALGCAPSLVDARRAVNRSSESFAILEPALEKQRAAAGEACFEASPPGSPEVRPCLDAVRARWRPVVVAVSAMYAALTAAQGTVGAAEAAAAVGRTPSVAQVLAVVFQAIDAAEKLQRAVDELHRDIKPGNDTKPAGGAP